MQLFQSYDSGEHAQQTEHAIILRGRSDSFSASATMASRDQAGSVRPRSRRSIAHVQRGMDQENATTDIAAMKRFATEGRGPTRDKKSRSKSLGPGGLDALQSLSGNRRKVCALTLRS